MNEIYKPDLRFLQAELKRVTDLIQFTDRKATILITFYSAAVGVVITQKGSALRNISILQGTRLVFYWIIIAIIVICFFYGMYHIVRSVFPSLKNKKINTRNQSLDYLNLVAYEEFPTEEELKNHMIEQIYAISLIANKKMESIRKCDRNLFLLTFLAVVFLLVF